jgi:hypothetical protein
MTFKKIGMLFVVMLLVVGAASAATKIPADQLFQQGKMWITPQIGISSWGGFPIGASFEVGITPNIGVGASAMYQSWSVTEGGYSVIMLAGEGLYHLGTLLKVDNLDVYAGAALGYYIVSWSANSGYSEFGATASALFFGPIVGGRYYISPKIAISLRFLGSFMGFSGVGTQLGVAFNLK